MSELLKVGEAAERLTVSTRTVYNLIERGDLVQVKIGAASRVTAESVAAYIRRGGSGG